MATEALERLRTALADRYRIERELGAGGMATVYLAHDLKHDRPVALKVLRQELAAALGAERFHREIQIAAKLQHPNILPLHDSGEAGGFLYYVMPFVEGQSLRERMAREGALPVGDTVRILRDVVDALTEAHAHGVVHRDIKPENIMLRGHHALVTDFGVAKAVSEATGRQTLTTAGVALGTPAYMAPEQASADPHLDHRVDIYAVGAVAYELLTGRPVFMGTTPQMVLSAHVTEAPQPITRFREAVPRALEALVMRCLAKQPADRPQTTEELLLQLEALATPSGGITPTETAPATALSHRWRFKTRWLAAATAAVVLVAIGLVLLRPRGPGPPATGRTGGSPGVSTDTLAIVVLPFTNQSGAASDQPFADGLTDEITEALGKVAGLRVTGRTSAYAYRDQTAEPATLRERLHVTHALEGTYRRAGNRLRVRVDLVSTGDGLVKWGDTYERPVGDEFTVQDSITAAVVGALRLRLVAAQLAGMHAGRTTRPEAHALYDEARFFLHQYTEAGLRRSIQLFERAIALDSNYASAWAGVADAWVWLADQYVAPLVAYPQARAAAMRALAIDSLVGEAHAVLGHSLEVLDWDFATAEREMRRAVELDPGSVTALFDFADFACSFPGSLDEGLALARRATLADPLDPLASWEVEGCLYALHRWDDLLSQHRRTMAIDSTFFYAAVFDGEAYRHKGQLDSALAVYRRAQLRVPDWPIAGLGVTLADAGRYAEAREVMRALEAYAVRHYLMPTYLAWVHAALGERDSAFADLDRALEVHDASLCGMDVWPFSETLRGDQRFAALHRKVFGK